MTFEELGEKFRAYREARGLSVVEVAARLKLPARTLYAIEEGDMGALPHEVYAKGFARSYAKALRFPEEDLEAALAELYPAEASEENAPSAYIAMVPAKRGGDRFVALLLILLLLVLPVGLGWFVIANYGESIMETVKRPLSAVSGSMAGTEQPAEQPAVAAAVPEPVPPVAPVSVDPAPAQAAEPAPQDQPDASPPETAPSVPDASRAAPVAETPAALPVTGKHVLINARAECWIRAVVDGQRQRRFTLQPGESRLIEYDNRASITLGNAGGVEVTHNGKPYPLDARSGERRTVTFQ